VVPAAGSGTRRGAELPKQFLKIGGRTVLEHSVQALWGIPSLAGMVVVSADSPVLQAALARFEHRKMVTVAGGLERCHSVLAGLRALLADADTNDWVLVHDAARPCVRAGDLQRLIQSVTDTACGGLLGVPVHDTLKRAETDNTVVATVDRAGLWHAQTPQMFRLGQLQAALETALDDGFEVTDEASAMEHAAYHPLLVEGHADNLKITRPEDLAVAELYLEQQGRL
jgi:2-C-methyl-D-erythritol 4-phosphate cytidylyltransferase